MVHSLVQKSKHRNLVTFIALVFILYSVFSIQISHAAVKSCSSKADTSRAKLGNEKIIGSFTGGGTFSFCN